MHLYTLSGMKTTHWVNLYLFGCKDKKNTFHVVVCALLQLVAHVQLDRCSYISSMLSPLYVIS